MDVISVSSHFSGNFSFGKYTRIEGKIDGTVSSSGLLIVGEMATLKADLIGKALVIQGTVYGNITAEESVTIHSTGDIHGDIKSPKIEIIDGAKIEGKILMSRYHPDFSKQLEITN